MSFTKQVTPYYELDLNILRLNFLHFQKAIGDYYINGVIAYSVKANYNRSIILTLNDLGSCFEVCSEREILKMFEYGISANKLVINGFISNKDLLLHCINQGALFIAGSMNDLAWLCSCKFRVITGIGLRLNLDYIKQGKEYFSFESRFGISLRDSLSFLKTFRKKCIFVKCLQAHFSGNSRHPEIYLNILKELLKNVQEYEMDSVSMLDIGGGYKISDEFWKFENYLAVIATIKKQLNKFQIIFEPGNCIVRTVGDYHTKVLDTFKIADRNYVLVDGSSIHLNKNNRNISQEYNLKFQKNQGGLLLDKQIIVGNSCKESDVIMVLKNEPALKIDDILVLKNLGAYTINEIADFILKKPNIFVKNEN
jgi:diaminopimelate decarboxylase